MRFGEKILDINQLAQELGRSEQYIRKIEKLGAPICGGRGYLSEVFEWMKKTRIKPFSKKLKKVSNIR